MLAVGTYWWQPATKKYYDYTADDVRILKDMVKKNLTKEHEFVVITDQPEIFEYDKDIRAIPLDKETDKPGTCYARLMTFHPDGAEIFGERFLQIDLDTIIVGNMDKLVSRKEDLVMWHNPCRIPWEDPINGEHRPFYNTSCVFHKCGTRGDVIHKFKMFRGEEIFRDDQWFLSAVLGCNMPYFDGEDGVYRLARKDTPGSGVDGELPKNAVLVTFPGSNGKPWDKRVMEENPWIAEYRTWNR